MESQFWYGMLSGSVLLSLLFWWGINWTFRNAQKKHEAGRADWEKDYKNTLDNAYKSGVGDATKRFKDVLTKRFNPDRTVRVQVATTEYPCTPKDVRVMLLKDHNWQNPIGEAFLHIQPPTPNIQGSVIATINFRRDLSDDYVRILKLLRPTIGGQVKYKDNGKEEILSMEIYEVSLCVMGPMRSIKEQEESAKCLAETSLGEYRP